MSTETIERSKLSLSISDRCDKAECGSQAYVALRGTSGELFFCAHHYEKIINTASGYEKIMSFALEILDNREVLKKENRLIGDN